MLISEPVAFAGGVGAAGPVGGAAVALAPGDAATAAPEKAEETDSGATVGNGPRMRIGSCPVFLRPAKPDPDGVVILSSETMIQSSAERPIGVLIAVTVSPASTFNSLSDDPRYVSSTRNRAGISFPGQHGRTIKTNQQPQKTRNNLCGSRALQASVERREPAGRRRWRRQGRDGGPPGCPPAQSSPPASPQVAARFPRFSLRRVLSSCGAWCSPTVAAPRLSVPASFPRLGFSLAVLWLLSRQMAVSYIGSRLSLISQNGIRYEGKLTSLDAENGVMILESVRMMGTEGRRTPDVPARSEVYPSISFRGTEVVDLKLISQPAAPAPQVHAPPQPQPPPFNPFMATASLAGVGAVAPVPVHSAPETIHRPPFQQRQAPAAVEPVSSQPAPAPAAVPGPATEGGVRPPRGDRHQHGGRGGRTGAGGHREFHYPASGPAPAEFSVGTDFDFAAANALLEPEHHKAVEHLSKKPALIDNFFDTMSSDMTEKAKSRGYGGGYQQYQSYQQAIASAGAGGFGLAAGAGGPSKRAEQRKINAETFGEVAAAAHGGGRGRYGGRGRGGQRSRGNRSQPQQATAMSL